MKDTIDIDTEQNLIGKLKLASGNLPEQSAYEAFDLKAQLDSYSLESIVELKISRFLEQIGGFYPEDLHGIFMQKIEKPLIKQILHRTGGNQVHAARILGINRNTLRKKMKIYGFT